MSNGDEPDLTLFLDILRTLERIGAPYMVIGGFAATLYGITRTTYDIDMVVDLKEQHIQALALAYPSPRYYADPEQMRSSIRMGMPFNIIDGTRGEKADLSPLTRDSRYRFAFGRRIRQRIEWEGVEPFEAWCARYGSRYNSSVFREAIPARNHSGALRVVRHYGQKELEMNVATNVLTIPSPQDLLLSLKKDDSGFEDEAKLLLAVKLYEMGRVTIGMAAPLAGVDRVSFMFELDRFGLSPIGVDAGDWVGIRRNDAAHAQG